MLVPEVALAFTREKTLWFYLQKGKIPVLRFILNEVLHSPWNLSPDRNLKGKSFCKGSADGTCFLVFNVLQSLFQGKLAFPRGRFPPAK